MASRRSKSLAKRSTDSMTLVIDTEDKYSQMENYFYVNQSNLFKIKSLTSEQFNNVIIKNTKVELISPLFLTNLFTKMKINGTGEIIISEPISVMQSYEAKTIKANAKIAGFEEIKENDSFFFDERVNKKIPTIAVTFKRPEKRGNLQEEVYKQYENKMKKYSEVNNIAAIRRRSTAQNVKNSVSSSSNRRISTAQNNVSPSQNIPSRKRLSTQNISPTKFDSIPASRRLSRPIENTNNNINFQRNNIRRTTESNDRISKYSKRK